MDIINCDKFWSALDCQSLLFSVTTDFAHLTSFCIIVVIIIIIIFIIINSGFRLCIGQNSPFPIDQGIVLCYHVTCDSTSSIEQCL